MKRRGPAVAGLFRFSTGSSLLLQTQPRNFAGVLFVAAPRSDGCPKEQGQGRSSIPRVPIPASRGWFIHRDSLAFVPIVKARRDHPTPRTPSIAARLKFTRLVKVHFRYGLHACWHPQSGSGPPLSGVASALRSPSTRAPYLRSQPTSFCGRTFTCKEEQISNRSERDLVVQRATLADIPRRAWPRRCGVTH